MLASNEITLMVIIAFIVMTPAAAPQTTLGSRSLVLDQKQTHESQIPVTEYSAPEPADSAERTKRKEKSLRYRKVGPKIKEDTRILVVTESDSGLERLAQLPIAHSDVVVIGEVRNAEAYLSDDKSGIYSEFSIRIEQVLRSNGESSFNPGSLIVAEREGGGVRFPSGHVQHYGVDGERMPKVWSRYVFFLKRNDPGQDFRLLKGYELRAGRVFPMDYFSRDAVHKGMDQDLFINAVRNAITESSQTKSDKARQDQ